MRHLVRNCSPRAIQSFWASRKQRLDLTAVTSGSWSALQQFAQVSSSVLIAILLIRNFSVHEYGIYAYALALTSIATNFMSAGLNALAVREIVNRGPQSSPLIATLLAIRLTAGFVAYSCVLLLALTSGSLESLVATAIASLAVFGRALEAPEMWFLSQLRLGITARLKMAVVGTFLLVRVVAVLVFPSLWLMIALVAVEAFVSGAAVVMRYRSDASSGGLGRVEKAEAYSLVRRSTPLIISSALNQVNSKIDIVFIQAMISPAAVGLYSAAARVSELAYFLPIAFMNATFPRLLEARARGASGPAYQGALQSAYNRAFWSGVGVAVVTAAVGSQVIRILFGERYLPSIPVLLIHVVACPFVFMGAVYSKWIVAEGLLWSSAVRHGLGALVNCALNLVLIPMYGITGAATATLISYAAAAYLAAFIGARSRAQAFMMSRAMIVPLSAIVRRVRNG